MGGEEHALIVSCLQACAGYAGLLEKKYQRWLD
jgi:hypothetical protein